MSTVTTKKTTLNKMGLFYLLIVYVIWGSTYLAIRVGLREGAGFTPFIFGSMRALCAGLILTYSYVNPIIAVILGWVILAEKITPWTVARAALVLLAVNGVFRERKKRQQIVEHK
jgi:drug/metabolite transporter (DMT)-like permease